MEGVLTKKMEKTGKNGLFYSLLMNGKDWYSCFDLNEEVKEAQDGDTIEYDLRKKGNFTNIVVNAIVSKAPQKAQNTANSGTSGDMSKEDWEQKERRNQRLKLVESLIVSKQGVEPGLIDYYMRIIWGEKAEKPVIEENIE